LLAGRSGGTRGRRTGLTPASNGEPTTKGHLKTITSRLPGRKTTGAIELTEWSEHPYHDAKSALKGDDFVAAKPFTGCSRS
jgi:hypothetical protein